MRKHVLFSSAVTIVGLVSSFAHAGCQLKGYYVGSSPVLTTQIPVDKAIEKDGSFRNYAWTLPDNAPASDSSFAAMNATVDDLSLGFRKAGDQIAIHLDLAATLDRRNPAAKDPTAVTHIIRDFIISRDGGSTGLVYGDHLAVQVACSRSK